MNQTLLEIQKFGVAVSLQPKQEVKKIKEITTMGYYVLKTEEYFQFN